MTKRKPCELPDDVYAVCFLKGTEPPFSGKYNDFFEPGTYRCVCCETPLFRSSSKFLSSSGWPSFFEPLSSNVIQQTQDNSHGMTRIEVTCATCGAHLGHVFEDGPKPTGLRYCINSLSLSFEAE